MMPRMLAVDAPGYKPPEGGWPREAVLRWPALTAEVRMRKVVIDCDPGIDDALALMLALASPELQVQAVTCVAGNRPLARTTDNAARLLALAGRQEVPVHAGCARPLAQPEPRCNLVHGEDGLGGAALPPGPAPAPGHAVEVLARQLLDSPPGTLTLIAVGPLTNLALAEIQHPGLLRRAEALLVMGGAVFRGGNVTPHAEFNFHADPLAAQVVLGAGAGVRLFGLDVTAQAVMHRAWVDSLAALPNRAGRAAHAMLQRYASREPRLHDACPVAWAIDPSLFRSERHALAVEWRDPDTEGKVSVQAPAAGSSSAGTVHEVVTGVDNERLMALVRSRIATLP